MMNQRNNFLIVSANLYRRKISEPCTGGSDLSMEEDIIPSILPYAENIFVISLARDDLPATETIDKNLIVHRVREEEIDPTMKSLEREHGINFVLTQLMFSDYALLAAKRLGLKTVYFARSLGVELDLSKGGDFPVDVMVAVSNYVAKNLEEQFQRKVDVVYNTFNNKDRIIGEPVDDPEFDITMINPTEAKGGEVFFVLSRQMPQRKFRAIKGWTDLKTDEGDYDPYLMELMAMCHNKDRSRQNDYIPNDPQPPALPNLTISDPVYRVGEIFQNTRLLLVPSKWDEAFGRVVVENAMNGGFTLASNNGGLPESMGIAGYPGEFLVDDFQNPEAWRDKIEWFFGNQKSFPKPEPKLPEPRLPQILGLIK